MVRRRSKNDRKMMEGNGGWENGVRWWWWTGQSRETINELNVWMFAWMHWPVNYQAKNIIKCLAPIVQTNIEIDQIGEIMAEWIKGKNFGCFNIV